MNGAGAHAVIVAAEPGAGRDYALEAIASALCASPQAPCGLCKNCRRVFGGAHPDVHTLGDGKAAIPIDDVRALIADEHICPLEAPFKAYVILGAERMSDSAQNALLKTLEDPDGDARFFLVTERPDALLPTVVSRAATVRPKKNAPEATAERLIAEGYDKRTAAAAAMLSGGSVKKAEALASDGAYMNRGFEAAEALAGFVASREKDVSALRAFAGTREDALRAVWFWQALMRDALAEASGSRDPDRFFSPNDAAAGVCARRRGRRGAQRLLAALIQTRAQIEGNVNPLLAADGFLAAVLKEKIN